MASPGARRSTRKRWALVVVNREADGRLGLPRLHVEVETVNVIAALFE